MDDNVIEFPAIRLPPAPKDRLQEVLELEQEVFELRHTISVLAVELVGYRERYG
jgi:hypothetical protein